MIYYISSPTGELTFALAGEDNGFLKLEPDGDKKDTHMALSFENEEDAKQSPPSGYHIYRDGSSKPLEHSSNFVFLLRKGDTYRVLSHDAAVLRIESQPQSPYVKVKVYMHGRA